MSRALLTLWAARVTSEPKPDWASNSKRMLRFSVLVTVVRGDRKNKLFYQVSVYAAAAETLIAKCEAGTFGKGSVVNILGRVESHRVYTDSEGVPQVGINVTALEVEPIFGWMNHVGADEDEDDATS